jgi:four helix bundle protein
MFLTLNHQRLVVYSKAKELICECYKLTNFYPPHERFNLTQQIRRAAISVMLNISEGSSRKSELERKRYFEIARGSIIEIDAAIEISSVLGYLDDLELKPVEQSIKSSFALICLLIQK